VDRTGQEWSGLVLFSLSGIKFQKDRRGEDWSGEEGNGPE